MDSVRKDDFLSSIKMDREFSYYSLKRLAGSEGVEVEHTPYSIRVLLENLPRNVDDYVVEMELLDVYEPELNITKR
ncbi:MAG: hypothetical protein NXY59_06390 [Aigarchaeota archaeon]|nr:hypothetical protein [Candidatus Pelearchaeum maunauluense]